MNQIITAIIKCGECGEYYGHEVSKHRIFNCAGTSQLIVDFDCHCNKSSNNYSSVIGLYRDGDKNPTYLGF